MQVPGQHGSRRAWAFPRPFGPVHLFQVASSMPRLLRPSGALCWYSSEIPRCWLQHPDG